MKSLKKLRQDADKRASLKNKDGSVIHYRQQDQVPVIGEMTEHSKYHEWLNNVMEKGASKFEEHHTSMMGIKGAPRDRHHHTIARNQDGHIVGSWNHRYNSGIAEEIQIVESLDQLYPIFENAGVFEHTNPAVHVNNPEHPAHGSGAHLPPLQSNGGLKKWRKKNGPPDHKEVGPIRTDNVVEDKITKKDLKMHIKLHKIIDDLADKAVDIKEETLIEAGKAKTDMKRKYLGKSKGRTKVGTKAHPVDTEPKIVLKDNPLGRVSARMPQPMPSRGI